MVEDRRHENSIQYVRKVRAAMWCCKKYHGSNGGYYLSIPGIVFAKYVSLLTTMSSMSAIAIPLLRNVPNLLCNEPSHRMNYVYNWSLMEESIRQVFVNHEQNLGFT